MSKRDKFIAERIEENRFRDSFTVLHTKTDNNLESKTIKKSNQEYVEREYEFELDKEEAIKNHFSGGTPIAFKALSLSNEMRWDIDITDIENKALSLKMAYDACDLCGYIFLGAEINETNGHCHVLVPMTTRISNISYKAFENEIRIKLINEKGWSEEEVHKFETGLSSLREFGSSDYNIRINFDGDKIKDEDFFNYKFDNKYKKNIGRGALRAKTGNGARREGTGKNNSPKSTEKQFDDSSFYHSTGNRYNAYVDIVYLAMYNNDGVYTSEHEVKSLINHYSLNGELDKASFKSAYRFCKKNYKDTREKPSKNSKVYDKKKYKLKENDIEGGYEIEAREILDHYLSDPSHSIYDEYTYSKSKVIDYMIIILKQARRRFLTDKNKAKYTDKSLSTLNGSTSLGEAFLTDVKKLEVKNPRKYLTLLEKTGFINLIYFENEKGEKASWRWAGWNTYDRVTKHFGVISPLNISRKYSKLCIKTAYEATGKKQYYRKFLYVDADPNNNEKTKVLRKYEYLDKICQLLDISNPKGHYYTNGDNADNLYVSSRIIMQKEKDEKYSLLNQISKLYTSQFKNGCRFRLNSKGTLLVDKSVHKIISNLHSALVNIKIDKRSVKPFSEKRILDNSYLKSANKKRNITNVILNSKKTRINSNFIISNTIKNSVKDTLKLESLNIFTELELTKNLVKKELLNRILKKIIKEKIIKEKTNLFITITYLNNIIVYNSTPFILFYITAKVRNLVKNNLNEQQLEFYEKIYYSLQRAGP